MFFLKIVQKKLKKRSIQMAAERVLANILVMPDMALIKSFMRVVHYGKIGYLLMT